MIFFKLQRTIHFFGRIVRKLFRFFFRCIVSVVSPSPNRAARSGFAFACFARSSPDGVKQGLPTKPPQIGFKREIL